MSLLKVADVATYLQMNEDTVRRLARSGDLVGSRHGNRWRFDMADVEEYVHERRRSITRRRRRRAA